MLGVWVGGICCRCCCCSCRSTVRHTILLILCCCTINTTHSPEKGTNHTQSAAPCCEPCCCASSLFRTHSCVILLLERGELYEYLSVSRVAVLSLSNIQLCCPGAWSSWHWQVACCFLLHLCATCDFLSHSVVSFMSERSGRNRPLREVPCITYHSIVRPRAAACTYWLT